MVAEQVTTRLPVRSALFKQHTGGLVVRWVTTGESPLLNVFFVLTVDRNILEGTLRSQSFSSFARFFSATPTQDIGCSRLVVLSQ
jgi:hypothetical protein